MMIDPIYRREVGHADLLTPQDVNRLAQRIEQGRAAAARPNEPGQWELIEAGKQARKRLIEANLRLVMHVARRYQGYEMDLMDLIQEGNLGLIHAVEKYDYRKGNRFGTYAIWWIHQSISRALLEQSQLIHIPLYKMEQLKQFRRKHLAAEVLPEDVAHPMSLEELQDFQQLDRMQEVMSLDRRREIDGDEFTLRDLLEDDPDNTPEHIILAQAFKQQILDLLMVLKPRERQVIQLRYGLQGECPHNLPQTAKRTHLSNEGVRITEARALKRLNSYVMRTGLHNYRMY